MKRINKVMNFIFKKQQNFAVLVIVLAVLFLDQICKLLALQGFWGISLERHYHSLLGLSANFYFIILFFFVLVLSFKKSIFLKSNFRTKVAFAFFSGGIVSNALDMFFYSYIIDYITFPHLLSFNIADLAISTGAVLLGYNILKNDNLTI